MRKIKYPESAHTANIVHAVAETPPTYGELPNRLLTAFEVAEFVGCHEETVRRADLRGCSSRSGSASGAGGFTHATCSTGLRAERQLESCDPETQGAQACEGGRMAIRDDAGARVGAPGDVSSTCGST